MGEEPVAPQTLSSGQLHRKLREYGFRIESCTPECLGNGGILIWPVVLREEITIIHQAEIEVMRLMCKLYHWKVVTLISDCGKRTKDLDKSKIVRFKNSIEKLMEKRDIPSEKIEYLSRYFDTNDASRASDILKNFIELSGMQQKELAELKNKEYREEIKSSNEQLPVINYILPLLQLSVVSYLSDKEYKDKKTLVVAGSDELKQWKYICHKTERLGSLLIPTLKEDKDTGCWQQEIERYLSEEQICEKLRYGNFGFWCYTMFVLLRGLSDGTTELGNMFRTDCLEEWRNNQFKVPNGINPEKLASEVWQVASLAIAD